MRARKTDSGGGRFQSGAGGAGRDAAAAQALQPFQLRKLAAAAQARRHRGRGRGACTRGACPTCLVALMVLFQVVQAGTAPVHLAKLRACRRGTQSGRAAVSGSQHGWRRWRRLRSSQAGAQQQQTLLAQPGSRRPHHGQQPLTRAAGLAVSGPAAAADVTAQHVHRGCCLPHVPHGCGLRHVAERRATGGAMSCCALGGVVGRLACLQLAFLAGRQAAASAAAPTGPPTCAGSRATAP